jgi:hypothetical protein
MAKAAKAELNKAFMSGRDCEQEIQLQDLVELVGGKSVAINILHRAMNDMIGLQAKALKARQGR